MSGSPHPWSPDGTAFKALRRTVRHLERHTDLVELDDEQLLRLGQQLADVIELAEELSSAIQQAVAPASDGELSAVDRALMDSSMHPKMRRALMRARDRRSP